MRGGIVLSLYWFLLLGGLGTFFPFYALYLTEVAGLSGAQTGVITAILPLLGLLAQPVWGQLADRTGLRARVLTLLSFGASFGYLCVFFARDFPQLVAATAILALFSSAVMPMCVSVSLALLSAYGPHAFGWVRAWGTVGFFVTVVGFPYLGRALTQGTDTQALTWTLPTSASLYAAAGLVSLAIPANAALSRRAQATEWRTLLRNPAFVRLLALMFCAYLCLHGPMVFFPVFVRALGGTVETISHMWIFMLILEIPLIALSGMGFQRFGGRSLLVVGVLAGAIRWIVCGTTVDLTIVYAAQILHGVIVAGLIIGAPLYVESVVPAQLRSTAQSLLSMMGIGLGGITSSLIAGVLVDRLGPSAPARIGGIGALVVAGALRVVLPGAGRARSTREDAPGG